MFKKIQRVVQMIQNMGWRYIFFRTGFELKKRTGILKGKFPLNPVTRSFYTLDFWRKNTGHFFFESKATLTFNNSLSEDLKNEYEKLTQFKYPFFSSLEYDLGANFDWMTNPDSGHTYNPELHWLDINDYDASAGDIKFVWEPSRFSHLYTIIRYDKHSGVDCSKRVFSEIESWLNANKINQGPNFKCSQEISLRVLNWTFALYYYKDSPNLTELLFNKIQHYIYWQIEHVYHNINFSRIAVRNNHAITETLLLFIAGTLFPEFPNAQKWKKDGKRWFEQEVAYQIYEDGTFLQFSMNYHRVVIQLLTWGIKLSELNGERFSDIVYERARKSLTFLLNTMDLETGWLPNYGNNDGALFFKLSNAHYRDYRPQLEALSYVLGLNWKYKKNEDALWYNTVSENSETTIDIENGYVDFNKGGYHIYRNNNSLSFIRCGDHKDRPAQADNLHLDVWHNHLNILNDGGTYKYNAPSEDLKYFMGTRSHNTVMLGNHDQMEKGSRFIWYHWTQCESVETKETAEEFIFEGTILAFQHLDSAIRHKRKVTIDKNSFKWTIEDFINAKPDHLPLNQIWHTCYPEMLNFECSTEESEKINPGLSTGYYSTFYGKKEECTEIIFSTLNKKIKTIITLK